jgi:hypothetical protein
MGASLAARARALVPKPLPVYNRRLFAFWAVRFCALKTAKFTDFKREQVVYANHQSAGAPRS